MSNFVKIFLKLQIMGIKNKHKKQAKQKESKNNDEEKKKIIAINKESTETVDVIDSCPPEQMDDTGLKKSYRKRKKHFYNAIRQQMEFYFGDANLSKDRFLKRLIDQDPCKPLLF